ncbi:MAG: hypothetical protein NZ602_01385 [Thermoguttaceae bacterium]|nr:hypothetical protein [Thermoguttaceae bacterium]MDW8037203.1 hypothetical protein [Thermoguttaceae bacterium]
MTWKKGRGVWLGILGTWLMGAEVARLAEAQDYRSGDVLITRTTAPVMDEDRVMTTIPGGSKLVAGEIRWPWVLVAVKKDQTDQDKDEHCPECGQKDWTRGPGIVFFRVQDGKLIVENFVESSAASSPWIRGWVHARYLYRQPDCGESSITFQNNSEADALVRLVGPQRRQINVPAGKNRTLYNVRAGHYYILVRYDDGRRVAGQHFNVEATATTYSKITITLHGVIGGNYPTRGISEKVFDSWGESE